ncbi:hypothetical protein L6164_009914 [Bauhinia variegata]|uniref:Uncharacterized protein n=1 Tax=Bauhinia variegata TaxID=167791 RepID=A0ACB9PMR2_BAUVA|nr:hypothetical protein L6164_009914 [Bauhinia variegata]
MRGSKTLVLIYAIALLTQISASSLSAEKDPLFPEFIQWHVYVVNGLCNNQNLLATCKSRDDDLGTFNLSPGTNLTWSFRTNFFHSTMFWCSVSKEQDKASASFEVFWYDARLFNKCQWKNCIWVAKDDGIYLTDLDQNQDELRYKWEGA